MKNLKKVSITLLIFFSMMMFCSVMDVKAEDDEFRQSLNFGYEANDSNTTGSYLLYSKTCGFNGTDDSSFCTPAYYKDISGNIRYNIYSLEHNANFRYLPTSASIDSDVYYYDSEIQDMGLLYILDNTIANNKYVVTDSSKQDVFVERWITQTAIWMYLRATDQNTRTYLSDADVEKIQNVTKIKYLNSNHEEVIIDFGEQTLYNTYIAPLLATARNYTSITDEDLEIKASIAGDSFSKSSDGKYYQSELVNVTCETTRLNYKIELSGIEGIRAVDVNGNVLNLNSVPSGTNFYVQVPVDKVTTEVQNIKVFVSKSYSIVGGQQYSCVKSD